MLPTSKAKKDANPDWRLMLFNKSILKREKYGHIARLLGDTTNLRCLDIGSESGAISYLLRARGGTWKSVDHEEEVVEAIRELVKTDVYLIDGHRTAFADNEFDRIVIVDILEHIEDDQGFVEEMFRILKPGGELIINSPHYKSSILQRVRQRIGLTEETLGSERLGYTVQSVEALVRNQFTIVSHTTYRKFFSQLVDTIIVFIVSRLKQGDSLDKHAPMVTEADLTANRGAFRLYKFVYPWVWAFCRLDAVLAACDGYMLVVKAKVNKRPDPAMQTALQQGSA